MNVLPITMLPLEVSAILTGRKRQARFEIAGEPAFVQGAFVAPACPFAVGDMLWIREPWGATFAVRAYYQATHEKLLRDDGWRGKWLNADTMPRHCSRLTLLVTEIRIQRLQEISERDAISEGIWPNAEHPLFWMPCAEIGKAHISPVLAFRDLWRAVRGDSWATNPRVFAVAFDVYKRNVDEVVAEARRPA